MDNQAGDAAAGEKPRGIFGRVFGGGGKRYKAAKMGKQLEMYYNEKLKCWVVHGEEAEKEKELAALVAPPLKSMSMPSMPASSTQEDAGNAAANGGGTKPPSGGGPPIYGGARGTSRYASASSFSINTAGNGAAPPSLMAGLNPPSAFGLPGGGGSGGGAAPAVFKPMVPAAVQQENEEDVSSPSIAEPTASAIENNQQQEDTGVATTAALDTQYDNTNTQYYNNNNNDQNQPQHHHQEEPNNNTANNSSLPPSAISDPVILEVLSFWSYYRNCGYDPDAMAEWVDQNYEPEYAGINYEDMLLDPQIKAAVEQHISENKNPDAPPPTAAEAVGGNDGLSSGMIEDALVAEAAGEYIPPPEDQQQQQEYYQHGDGDGVVRSETTLVAPPPPTEFQGHHDHTLNHLPGAESGWTGFDDGVEIEGGGDYDVGDYDVGGDYDVPAAAAVAEAAGTGESAYMMHEYGDQQYGQYHTTDEYTVEDTTTAAAVGEVVLVGEGETASGQLEMPPAAAAVADAGVGIDQLYVQQQAEENQYHQPVEEEQWGYTTPAAGPSPARTTSYPGGGGGGGLGNGGVPRFPIPGQPTNQHDSQQAYPSHDNGLGVHPIFSPGQLAADLGVPRDAVSMSALFAAEAASVGTLSSRESEDGWSDHGDVVGLPGGGASTAAAGVEEGVEGGDRHDGNGSIERVVEGVNASIEVPPVDRPTSSASQVDVVGPWEAAAAAIEGTITAIPTVAAVDASEVEVEVTTIQEQTSSMPLPPAVVEMESKSTQADNDNNTSNVSIEEYHAVLSELEVLKEQLSTAATRAETATIELQRSQEEAAVHSATLAEIMGARDAALNEKHALEEEIEALKNQAERIPSLVEKVSLLETAAEEHARSFTDIESKVALLEEERDELTAKLAEAQAQDVSAATAAGEVAILQVELDEVKEALEARENECEDLKAALELKDDAIIELRAQETRANEAKNQEIAEIKSNFESQLASLRGELAAAREALAAAEESASDNVAAALEDVGERIQIAVTEAIEEKTAEFEERENAWKEELDGLRSQITVFESTLTEKDGTIISLQGQLITQLAESEVALAATEANLAAAVAEATATAAASKEAELQTAQTRVKELEKKFALAKKKIAGQTSQHDQLTAEIQALKQQLDQALQQVATDGGQHEEELAEMAQALSEAAAAQEALTTEASALQSRLEQLQATKEEEIQALANDNSQLAQMLGERDATIESLSSQTAALAEQMASLNASFEAEKAILGAHAQNDELLQQLQAELEAAKEDIMQWEAVAEDADKRCTAAEEALAAEEEAREEAAAAVLGMQEEVAALQHALASTEAQCNELAAMQELQAAHAHTAADGFGGGGGGIFGGGESNENSNEQLNAEVTALRHRLSELESELTIANDTLRSLDIGGFEDAVEDAEDLRKRLAAASQVAAAKEEELLKYKKQLVKAKKLRNADLEKIAALEQTIKQSGDGGGGDAIAPRTTSNDNNGGVSSSEIASLREEVSSLQEQLAAMRAASAEADDGLTTALSALDIEELKVVRLAELLMERGMEQQVVEEELNAVEEMVMMDEGGGEEESLV